MKSIYLWYYNANIYNDYIEYVLRGIHCILWQNMITLYRWLNIWESKDAYNVSDTVNDHLTMGVKWVGLF